jgi:citrate lyase beta subunit
MIFPNSRSILITPALKIELYNKAVECQADLFMIDFEDSIPLNRKDESRKLFLKNMCRIPDTSGYSFRINSLNSTEGLKDLLFLTENSINVNYLLVSKITSSHELRLIKDVFESANSRQPKLISLIENSIAVSNLDDIARSSDALLFGGADFALDFGLPINECNQLHARQMVALYANKYRIPAIDTPTFVVHDLEQLSSDCLQSKMLGFSGKLTISKGQVAIINQIYQYSQDEVNWARSILGADPKNSSIAVVNKQMVGTPFYDLAKSIISNLEGDHDAS